MPEKVIKIKVLTNQGAAFSDEATSIITPGDEGLLGVMSNHAPLISVVSPGLLRWKTPSGELKRVAVGSGMLEVIHNEYTLLVDSAGEVESFSGVLV